MTGHVMVLDRRTTADVRTVWQVLTDVSGHSDVLRHVSRVHVLSESDEYAVGLTWEETRTLLGHHGTERLEVVECHPPAHTTIIAHAKWDSVSFNFAISPGQDGTTRILLTLSADMSGRGPVGRLEWATWGNVDLYKTRRMLLQDLDDIAAEAERRTAGVPA